MAEVAATDADVLLLVVYCDGDNDDDDNDDDDVTVDDVGEQNFDFCRNDGEAARTGRGCDFVSENVVFCFVLMLISYFYKSLILAELTACLVFNKPN